MVSDHRLSDWGPRMSNIEFLPHVSIVYLTGVLECLILNSYHMSPSFI